MRMPVRIQRKRTRGLAEWDNPYYRLWDRGPEQLALITEEDAQ